MNLNSLKPNPGSIEKPYRKGRGVSQGRGKLSGKGMKGQNSRSGGGVRPGFEGGQTPLYRRIPKFGFKNPSIKKVLIVDFRVIEENFKENETISPATLESKLIFPKNKIKEGYLKVLGNGSISKAYNFELHNFSKTAEEKILKAKGTITKIEYKA